MKKDINVVKDFYGVPVRVGDTITRPVHGNLELRVVAKVYKNALLLYRQDWVDLDGSLKGWGWSYDTNLKKNIRLEEIVINKKIKPLYWGYASRRFIITNRK